jgi:hypothetical protein
MLGPEGYSGGSEHSERDIIIHLLKEHTIQKVRYWA